MALKCLLLALSTTLSSVTASALRLEHDSYVPVVPSPTVGVINAGIDTRLDAADFSERYREIISLMEVASTFPTCERIAVKRILSDCSKLDANKPDEEPAVALDIVKDEYAVRLAICELRKAGVAMAKACEKFQPLDDSRKKTRYFGLFGSNGSSPPHSVDNAYEQTTRAELGACMTALSASTNAWVSYSNSRQNAVAMCHSIRAEIEKDDILNMHRNAVETMQAYMERAAAELRHNEQKAVDLQDMDDGLMMELQEGIRYANIVLTQAASSMETRLETLFGLITTQTHEAELNLAHHIDRIQEVEHAAEQIQLFLSQHRAQVDEATTDVGQLKQGVQEIILNAQELKRHHQDLAADMYMAKERMDQINKDLSNLITSMEAFGWLFSIDGLQTLAVVSGVFILLPIVLPMLPRGTRRFWLREFLLIAAAASCALTCWNFFVSMDLPPTTVGNADLPHVYRVALVVISAIVLTFAVAMWRGQFTGASMNQSPAANDIQIIEPHHMGTSDIDGGVPFDPQQRFAAAFGAEAVHIQQDMHSQDVEQMAGCLGSFSVSSWA